MRLRTLASIVALLASSLSGPALSQALTGYVAQVEGDQTGAVLIRGSEAHRRLRLGENILAGDVVLVKPPTRVRIDTSGGPVLLCDPKVSGECRRLFQDTGQGQQPADIARRLSAMLAWFAAPQRNLITRSAEPPRFVIGSGRPQRIVAGERQLRIGWVDGEPPFRITLEAQGRPLARGETADRGVTLPAARLGRGEAVVRVTDGRDRVATLPLEIVAAPALASFAASAVDADHALLLQLASLAQMDGGAWTLETAQRLSPLMPRSPAAEVFQRALFAGDKL